MDFNQKKGGNPVVAIGYFFKGIHLLMNSPLRTFVLMPVLINIVLYSAALLLGYYYIADLINQFIPSWLLWLSWMLWPMFFVSFFIAGLFSFTVVANLLASPFYGKLSAKTLVLINGSTEDAPEQPLTKVIHAELNRAGYLLSRAIPLMILSFIPGINVLAPVLWALFGAWGMALEYMAYPMENAGVLFEEQKTLLQRIRFGALGFGGMAALGLALPIVNIIIAPAAVVGATLYVHDIKQG